MDIWTSQMLKYRLKKRHFVSSLMIAGVFFLAGAETASGAFLRDLSLGNVGEDVRELQVLLNRETLTRLALQGPGSPSQETAYFGPLTRNAVIKFQEKYASEILHPLGLIRGTGYVGPSTRIKLNALSALGIENASQRAGVAMPNYIIDAEKRVPTSEPLSFSSYQHIGVELTRPSSVNAPEIFRVSPSRGRDGTQVILHGRNFTASGNTVFAGFAKLENLPSSDSTTLTFEVKSFLSGNVEVPPEILAVFPPMEYAFYVENGRGRSNAVRFTILFD